MSEDAESPSSRRILIFGAAGQLGRALRASFAGAGSITAVGRDTVDLADAAQLRACIAQAAPHVILNAAAYTAVDRAESEPQLAYAINADAPRIMAEEARARNALLVHYSTDYVFDGSKRQPWSEDDAPNPLSVYGASKLAGERAVESIADRYLIFRTSWVYAAEGKNFLLTMLRLGRERDELSIVDDQVGAPTTSTELAKATRTIVDGVLSGNACEPAKFAGIYNMTCDGATSWFRFAQAIFARAATLPGINAPRLKPISSDAYPTPAKRPRNSVLSNQKLQARFDVRLAPWQDALDAVFEELRAGALTA